MTAPGDQGSVYKGPWGQTPAQSDGDAAVATGGGDGHSPGMEARITRLEILAEQAEKRSDRTDTKLDTIIDRLAHMPTVAGLWGMVATVIGVAVGMLAAFIAILAYLQDQRIAATATPPAPPVVIQAPPIVIQVPAPQPAPSPAPSK